MSSHLARRRLDALVAWLGVGRHAELLLLGVILLTALLLRTYRLPILQIPWVPARAIYGFALALVVAVAAGSALSGLAATPLSPRRWDNRLAVVRQIISDADGQPFSFRLVSADEPRDGWQAPWQYAFRYAGTGPDARVDLPTYVVFDPAEFGGGPSYGGHVVEGVRWTSFPAPASGASMLTEVLADPAPD